MILSVFSVFDRFKKIDHDAVENNWNARLSKQQIMNLPELKVTRDDWVIALDENKKVESRRHLLRNTSNSLLTDSFFFFSVFLVVALMEMMQWAKTQSMFCS